MSEPVTTRTEGEGAPSATGAALLGLLTSLASIASSVARSKVTALVIGPTGLGLAAEAQQIVSLATVGVGSFAGPALTRELAESEDPEARARVVAAAASWTLLTSILFGLVAWALSPFILPDGTPLELVAFAAIASVGSALSGVWSATLVAHQDLKRVASLAVATSVLTSALSILLCLFWGLEGLFAGLAISACVAAVWGARQVIRSLPGMVRAMRADLSRRFLRVALTTGLTALVAGAALQGALSLIRWRLNSFGGPELNGQYQAAWSIGSLYFGLIFSGLGNFYFPRFASAKSPDLLRAELTAGVQTVIELSIPILGMGIALRHLGVTILFSSEFGVAASILGWQFAGDVAKSVAWMQAGPLVYRGYLRAFLIVEVFAAACLGLGSLALIPIWGALGAGVAYFLTYLLYVSATAAALWSSERVSIGWKPAVQVAVASAVFAGCQFIEHPLFAPILFGVSFVLALRSRPVREIWGRILTRLKGRNPSA